MQDEYKPEPYKKDEPYKTEDKKVGAILLLLLEDACPIAFPTKVTSVHTLLYLLLIFDIV
jgi:hypothetical protein